MKFYPFNVGDYLAATAHLGEMEDLAYRRLLDVYYLREKPLPGSIEACARLARMDKFLPAVAAVLREFFKPGRHGYTHLRVAEELAAFRTKQAQKVSAAKARWEIKRLQHASALRVQCERNATNTNTNTNNKNNKGAFPILPEWMPGELWEEWRAARVGMRARMTAKAETLSLKTLGKLREAGADPRAVIEQSIERGWKGLFAVRTDEVKPGKPMPASAGGGGWWLSEAGTMAKGKALGIDPRPGETMTDYRGRLLEAAKTPEGAG